MINQELIDFIKKSRIAGQTDEQIKSALLVAGWAQKDINEGFNPMEALVVNYGENSSGAVQSQGANMEYAGFWIRVVAAIIDALIIMVGIVILGGLMAVGLIFIAKTKNSIFGFVFMAVMQVFFLVSVYGYFIWMTKKYGATLGKKAMRINVTSDNSGELGWGKVILRETVGKWVSGFIFSIGYLMVAFDSRKQGLHDKIAKTLVVYRNPQKKVSQNVVVSVVAGGFVLLIIISFGWGTLSGIMDARKKAQEKQDTKIDYTAPVSESAQDQETKAGYNGTKVINGVRADFSIDSQNRDGMCGTGITEGRRTIDSGHEFTICVKTSSCCDKINNLDFDVKSENKFNRILLKYNHEENLECNCPGSYVQLIYKITNLPDGTMTRKVVKNQPDAKIPDDPNKDLSEEEKLERDSDLLAARLKILPFAMGGFEKSGLSAEEQKQLYQDALQPAEDKYNMSKEAILDEQARLESLMTSDIEYYKKIYLPAWRKTIPFLINIGFFECTKKNGNLISGNADESSCDKNNPDSAWSIMEMVAKDCKNDLEFIVNNKSGENKLGFGYYCRTEDATQSYFMACPITSKGGECISSQDEKLDSDTDKFPDELEIIFGTDPQNKDTDGDSHLDGDELINGFNPLVNGK